MLKKYLLEIFEGRTFDWKQKKGLPPFLLLTQIVIGIEDAGSGCFVALEAAELSPVLAAAGKGAVSGAYRNVCPVAVLSTAAAILAAGTILTAAVLTGSVMTKVSCANREI